MSPVGWTGPSPGSKTSPCASMSMPWLSRVNVDDAALLLSELVTNAVHHGGGSLIAVRATCSDGILHCEVCDEGTHTPIRPCHAVTSLTDHGRGLQILATLASCWGTHLDTGGRSARRVVWFELRSPSASAASLAVETDPDILRRVLRALRCL